MNPQLRATLINPLNIAAYIAWAVIGYSVLQSTGSSSGLVPEPWFLPVAMSLHGLFMACFLGCQLLPRSERTSAISALLQLLIGLLLTAMVRYSVTPILMVIATTQLVQTFRPAFSLAIVAAANLGVYLIAARVWGAGQPLLFTLSYFSFQLFAGMMSWYALKAERSSAELALANAELIATRSLLAKSARDFERLHLSRELHDVAGHKLTALKLNLAALARDPRWRDEQAVALCAQLADELLADIRGVVQQLRLHDTLDLRRAIELLAAPFPRPQLHLELVDGARVAGFAQAEALLRTVQEALTNSARHSQAANLWVVLRYEGPGVALDIRDDGRGGGPVREGNGMAGMRERLESLGGSLHVERDAHGAVRLLATLPDAA